MGEVQHNEGEVYGISVNITSRVRRLAQAETMCLTEIVHEKGRSRVKAGFRRLGQQAVLKTIPESIGARSVAGPALTSAPTKTLANGQRGSSGHSQNLSIGLGHAAAKCRFWRTRSPHQAPAQGRPVGVKKRRQAPTGGGRLGESVPPGTPAARPRLRSCSHFHNTQGGRRLLPDPASRRSRERRR